MSKAILFLLVALLPSGLSGQVFHWAYHVNTSSSIGKKVTTSPSGQIYTAGQLTSNFGAPTDMDFGPGVLNLAPGIGNSNVYFAKYDEQGALAWAKLLFAQNYNNFVDDIAVTGLGELVITGRFNGTIDFDPGPDTFLLSNNNPAQDQMFLMKLDSNGHFNWAKKIGDSTGYTLPASLSLDSQQKIYLLSSFFGTIDFDPGPGAVLLSSTGNVSNSVVLHLDSTGNFQWVKQITGSTNTGRNLMHVDGHSLYLTGNFQSTIDADPGPGSFLLSGTSNNNLYIIRLHPNGDFIWARSVSSVNFFSNLTVTDLTASNHGRLFIGGHFSDSVDFDPGPGADQHNSMGSVDVFLTILDSSGSYLGTRSFGGPQGDQVSGLYCDTATGTVSILGRFQGSVDFDPDTAAAYVLQGCRSYLMVCDTTGEFRHAYALGSPNGSGGIFGESITGMTSQCLYVTGHFEGTHDANPGAGNFMISSPGAGNYMFLAKYQPCGTHTLQTLQFCDSALLWGVWYDSSTRFVQQFLDVNGCDSNISVDLKIKNNNSDTLEITECASYTLNGSTYNNSGWYTQVFTNAAGCDSSLILNLIIQNSGASVSKQNDTLLAWPSGLSYQWISCTAGQIIPGATSQTFVPAASGSYRVVVFFGANCTDTSSCMDLVLTAADLSMPEIYVFPNPSSRSFSLCSSKPFDEIKISLKDLMGRNIPIATETRSECIHITPLNACSGVYTLHTSLGIFRIMLAR